MTARIFTISLICCFSTGLIAQGLVNPGDANHDGRVDHHDILSVGYAYGSVGTPRTLAGPNGTQAFTLPWSNAFPNGLNYTHADADGNGQVNVLDLLFVSLNDGTTFSGGLSPSFSAGVPGVDAEINLNGGSDLDAQSISGANLNLPLRADNLLNDNGVNGIALSLRIDTSLVKDISFTFSEEWLSVDGSAFPFVSIDGDLLRIALTRFGPDPINEISGDIGTLSVTIIEDLVGLLPNTPDVSTTIVSLEGIQLVDGNFEALPTVGRGLNIAALSSVSSTSNIFKDNTVRLFPNPTDGRVQINSERPFRQLELFTATGARQLQYQSLRTNRQQLDLSDLSPGLYYLRLTDDDWSSTMSLILK